MDHGQELQADSNTSSIVSLNPGGAVGPCRHSEKMAVWRVTSEAVTMGTPVVKQYRLGKSVTKVVQKDHCHKKKSLSGQGPHLPATRNEVSSRTKDTCAKAFKTSESCPTSGATGGHGFATLGTREAGAGEGGTDSA